MSSTSLLANLGRLAGTFLKRFPAAVGIIFQGAKKLLTRPEVKQTVDDALKKAKGMSKKKILIASAAAVGGAIAISDIVDLTPEEFLSFLATLDEKELAEFVNGLGLSGEAANVLLSAVRQLQVEANSAQASSTNAGAATTGEPMYPAQSGDSLYGIDLSDEEPMGMARETGDPSKWSQQDRQMLTAVFANVFYRLFGNDHQFMEDTLTVLNMGPDARRFLYDELAFRK